MTRLRVFGAAALGAAAMVAGLDRARAETIELPTFDVVATTPLGGGEIDVSKVPGAVWQTGQQSIQTYFDSTIAQTLARQAPGVTVGNVSGNDFQPDISYRGFTASPVPGTPSGLAVYQNGVRINESFGDTVNWDMIPEVAIDKMAIVAGDPIFGLNAIGGALNVTMKNGFTWQGFEADLRGGSFGRGQVEIQYGKQFGDWSLYLAGTQINDGGWRQDSNSQLTNFYGDVGYRANGFESHLQLTAGNTQFGAAAFTPLQELQANWRSVYTVPQTTYNQMGMLAWTGTYAWSSTLNFQGGLYFRGFNQRHVDGNGTDVSGCDPYLCLNGAPLHDTTGSLIADVSQGGALDLGQIDRSWTQSRSVGGSGQAVDADKLYGRDNSFTVGASLDYGWTNFNGNSQLGVVPGFMNASLPVIGLPYTFNEPDSYLAPVTAKANNTYVGVYAVDTFNATDRLALTAGARFNFAGINLSGETGAFTNGYSTYSHVNPTVGLTYKLTPDLNVYAGYAMTNRAPTPLELGCADPARPCIIDNFLVSDPALKQVIGQTVQLGLRGNNDLAQWGRLNWSAGLFRTSLQNDIMPVQSDFTGFGYYTNVGTTLRQGAEVSVNWTVDRWSAYANYTFINAVYQSTFLEPSPYNPLADANGNIAIANGTPIAGIPKNTLKVGVDYAVTPEWKIGADMVASSGQVIFGAENGALPQLPGYAVFGVHTSYQVGKSLQIYGLIQNLFDQKYYTAGALYDTGAFPNAAPNLTDPRTLGPGKPFAVYAGLKYTM